MSRPLRFEFADELVLAVVGLGVGVAERIGHHRFVGRVSPGRLVAFGVGQRQDAVLRVEGLGGRGRAARAIARRHGQRVAAGVERCPRLVAERVGGEGRTDIAAGVGVGDGLREDALRVGGDRDRLAGAVVGRLDVVARRIERVGRESDARCRAAGEEFHRIQTGVAVGGGDENFDPGDEVRGGREVQREIGGAAAGRRIGAGPERVIRAGAVEQLHLENRRAAGFADHDAGGVFGESQSRP